MGEPEQPGKRRRRRRRRRGGGAPPIPIATPIDLGDGRTVVAHGDKPMTPETRVAVAELVRAAERQVAEEEDETAPVAPSIPKDRVKVGLDLPPRFVPVLVWAARVRGISEEQYVSQVVRAALARERVSYREAMRGPGEAGGTVRAETIGKVTAG